MYSWIVFQIVLSFYPWNHDPGTMTKQIPGGGLTPQLLYGQFIGMMIVMIKH